MWAGARGQQGHDSTTIAGSWCASFPPWPISLQRFGSTGLMKQGWADETVVCKFRMEQDTSLTALCADTTQQDDGSFLGHPWTNSQSYYLLLQLLPEGVFSCDTHSNVLWKDRDQCTSLTAPPSAGARAAPLPLPKAERSLTQQAGMLVLSAFLTWDRPGWGGFRWGGWAAGTI